jgi:hypothetical protein
VTADVATIALGSGDSKEHYVLLRDLRPFLKRK